MDESPKFYAQTLQVSGDWLGGHEPYTYEEAVRYATRISRKYVTATRVVTHKGDPVYYYFHEKCEELTYAGAEARVARDTVTSLRSSVL